MIALEWLRQASLSLKGSGIESARLDAIILFEFITKMPREEMLAHMDRTINWRSARKLQKALRQRARHYPIAYITGYKEFYGLKFKVNSDVLIPRPETEKLVDLAIKLAPKNSSVLDIGTGSGCVAISLARARKDLRVSASDTSAKALHVASQNAAHLGVSVRFIRSDLFKKIPSRYECVVANLPYVPDASKTSPETAFEPFHALFGGKDGLDVYREFFAQISQHLAPKGFLILEAEPKQHKKLISLAQKQNFYAFKSVGFALVCKQS